MSYYLGIDLYSDNNLIGIIDNQVKEIVNLNSGTFLYWWRYFLRKY